MQKYTYLIGIGVLAALAAAAFVPVTVVVERNRAHEDLKYIRRVWGEHSVGQRFNHGYPISGVEVLMRSKIPQVAHIIVHEESGKELARQAVALSTKDTWTAFQFHEELPPGENVVIFRAPGVASQDETIEIRFQIDSRFYAAGHMVVDGEESYGDLAFRTIRRTAAWNAIGVIGQITGTSAQYAVSIAFWGLLVASAVVAATALPGRYSFFVPLILVVFVAIAVRAPYTRSIEGVYGGDAFNYFSKALSFVQGDDPFSSDPRKGPLFSALLIPGIFLHDPLLWSRWVGVLAAAASAAMVPLVAKRLGLPWQAAVSAGVLLAVNPEFIWESPSGLANTLFAALILASIWMYVASIQSKKEKFLYALAVCAGLTFLTRYEGAIVGAILLPAAWILQKPPLKAILRSAAIVAIIVAIPFTSIIWSGKLGVRTLDDIQTDGGLYVVRDAEDFEKNLSRAQGFFAGMWIAFRQLPPVVPPVSIGLVAGIICSLVPMIYRAKPSYAQVVVGALLAAFLGTVVAMKSPLGREILIYTSLFAIGFGIAWLAVRQKKETIPIILVAAILGAIILVILPKSRYFLPLVPLSVLAITSYVLPLLGPQSPRWRQILVLFPLGIFAIYVFVDGREELELRLEHYNADAHTNAVMVQALQFLREDHGRVGFYYNMVEQPAYLYIPPSRLFRYISSDEDEATWIKREKIRYLVERESDPVWNIAQAQPEAVQRYHVFDTIHGDEKVILYKIFPEKLLE